MSAEQSRARPQWIYAVIGGLVALGGLVLLLLAAVFGFNVFGGGGRQEPAKVADVAGRTTFLVGQVSDLPGTDLVRIDINADRSDDVASRSYGSSGGSPDPLRNILLLDKGTGATRSILPNNDRRIVSSQFLPARADRAGKPDDAMVASMVLEADKRRSAEEAPPAYYLLQIRSPRATPDANERRARIDLLVGTLATGRQGFVMRGIDAIESSWMQSATQLGLVVRDDLALHYRVVDIPTLRVVTSRPIAIG